MFQFYFNYKYQVYYTKLNFLGVLKVRDFINQFSLQSKLKIIQKNGKELIWML